MSSGRRRAANAGAGERTRTADLLITNQLLYQLSYAGFLRAKGGRGATSKLRADRHVSTGRGAGVTFAGSANRLLPLAARGETPRRTEMDGVPG